MGKGYEERVVKRRDLWREKRDEKMVMMSGDERNGNEKENEIGCERS